jgi:hypothetical protein
VGVDWNAGTQTVVLTTVPGAATSGTTATQEQAEVADRINIERILEVKFDDGYVWVLPTPRETSVTAQEAAEITVLALEQYFDTDLTGLTLYMRYNDPMDGVEIDESNERYIYMLPSNWIIEVPPYGATSGNASSAYDARIMAKTGELFSLNRYIGAEETINNMEAIEVGPRGLWPEDLTEAQATVFANAAMDVAYERSMMEGEVTRAAVLHQWGLMWGLERVPSVAVRVQNDDGDEIVVNLINSKDYGMVVAGIGFDGSFNREDGGPMLFSWVYK